jgi:hypothetical protein
LAYIPIVALENFVDINDNVYTFLKKGKQKQMIKDPPCDEPNPLLYTHTKIHYIMYNLEGKYAHQVENNFSTPKLSTHHCTTPCFLDQDPSLHNII